MFSCFKHLFTEHCYILSNELARVKSVLTFWIKECLLPLYIHKLTENYLSTSGV